MRKMLSAAAFALAVIAIAASAGSAQTEVTETKYRLLQSSWSGVIYCINAGADCLVG